MELVFDKGRSWSALGLSLAVWSTIVAALLPLADGVFKGPLSFRYGMSDMHNAALLSMLATWTYDLRQTVDGLIYVGALLFIGAKFFESQTNFTIGFAKMDAAKISVKGPDDDNIVWIGHRYGSRLEAEAVAATIESRLEDSAAA